MADIPDFTVKTKPIDPTALASILQRRSELEEQRRQFDEKQKDARIEGLMSAVQTGQHIASNMMDLAEKRNRAKGMNDLTGLLTTPPPAPPSPIASSSALPNAGSFGVQPSAQDTQDYQQKLHDRQNAMVAALAKVNPDTLAKFADKSLFPPDKADKPLDLESKNIIYNGSPKVALYDKTSGNHYDAVSKQLLTGNIEPYSPMSNTDLTDADRKRLTPLAKAVVEGRASPSAIVNARGNEKEKLSLVASELDPNFDLSLAPQRIAMRKDFTPNGTSGKSLTALNTVIGHLDTLQDKLGKLDNTEIPKYSSLQNYLKKNTGKPEVDAFNATKTFVDNELGKIAQGSGVVTNQERSQIATDLNAASSPAQAKAVIATWMDLMKSRTDAIKSNWKQGMGGTTPPVPFINDKTKKILVKNGYDADTLEKKGANGSDKVDAFFASLLKK